MKLISLAALLLLTQISIGDISANASNTKTKHPKIGQVYETKVSWYQTHGRKTANGEKFNKHNLTTAHKNLPFGTIVKFTHLETNKTIIARVNDRGPFIKGREYDMSLGCARYLGIEKVGVTKIKVEILR